MRSVLQHTLDRFGNRTARGVGSMLRVVQQALTDSEYRSYLRLKYFNPDLLQFTGTTRMDRYPEIFDFVRSLIGADTPARILSFGCSTGEEVATLRDYFPAARITGADINRRSLSIAKQNYGDAHTRFIHSSRAELAKHGPFDVIFCLAVLVDNNICLDDYDDSSRFFPFRKFNRTIELLDSVLAEDGLLVIYVSNYRFRDADVAGHYELLQFDTSFADAETRNRVVSQYDRNNRRIKARPEWEIVFRKKAGSRGGR